uniref:C25 family cysteine peptidase n=1 Tax=Desulfococcus sp. TaxID=2025834 RepID=UPI003593DC3C
MRASKRIINLLIFLFFPSLTFLLFADTYDPLVYAWEPTDNTAFLNVSLNPEPSPLKFDVVAENGSLSVIIDSGTLNITPAGHDVTLSMDSFNTHMSPGDPMVPVRVVHMALPPDADLETLAFSHSVLAERVLNGVYSVAPAPPMATWDGTRTITDWGEDKNIVDNRNINVYGSDAFFVAEVVEPAPYSQLRKWQMAQFAYYPVQYNPVTGKLRIVERIQVDISYKTIAKAQNASNFSLTDDGMEDRAAVIIDNYAQAAPLYTLEGELHPSVDFDYVILTTERIVENSTRLNDFESFKENQGYSVLTVTENARYTSVGGSSSGPGWGGGTGDTAAENIRSWIRNNYLLLGIDYVLLIGNPDPFYGDIPMKMCWPRLGATRYPEYDHAPTDYYYADLTGNWDLDGDGNYGEYYGDFGSGGIDTNVEIYVGRIPIYNPSSIELDLILQKTIEYGTEVGDLGWRKKVLLPMEPSDDLTHAWPLAENIRNEYANPAGWNSYRIYDEDYGKSPEKTPCNATNVQNEWQNRYGLVTWWTHGSITTAVDVFDISSSINLDNAHPSFTFQCSCNNAYPEYEDNLGYSLLVNGAIGTISATRVSWYYVGDSFWEISGGNSYMADRYSKKIIDAVPSGKALFDMKMEASINTEGNWMNFLVFNLYGDPALKIDDAGLSLPPIETIIDNNNAGFTSGPNAWTWSQFTPGGYNTSYQYAPIGSGGKWAKWTFTVSTPGEYEIFAQWTSGDNRSPAAPYTIKNGAKTWKVTANQTRDGGQFNLLGTYPLTAGTLEVYLSDTPTGVVIADAVKIVSEGTPPIKSLDRI